MTATDSCIAQNPSQNGGFDTLYQAAKTILENEHTKALEPFSIRNYGLIDIWDSDDHSEFYIDAPGLNKEDIDISLEDNRIIVKATRNNDCESDEISVYSERYQNVIERNIMLPALCDVNTISSTYKDGVIIIKVDRIKANGEKNVKKIPVA